MALQIALAWSRDCEKELQAKGFEKREVYAKYTPVGKQVKGKTITDVERDAGDAEFFAMSNKPFQFVTTSWWGAGFG